MDGVTVIVGDGVGVTPSAADVAAVTDGVMLTTGVPVRLGDIVSD
jgi:hypothetical protein